jgi:glutamyl-tRNA(Gln) amidotransferase subunit D
MVESKAPGIPKPVELKSKPELPVISVLHTGGTIASRIDYSTGAVFASFKPEDLVSLVPEIQDIANIKTKLVMNIMSEDMRFRHYAKIAEAIKEEINAGVKGIILGHGTDTMHYTATALSFMLENLPVPVILVGSQRSTDRGSSDAAMNLICAAEFIKQADFAGIAICMHENTSDNNCVILPGTKSRKMHTSRRDAFKPINAGPIARVNYDSRKIEFLQKDYPKASGKELVYKPGFETNVGLLKVHTNMAAGQFRFFEEKGFKGLVIEGTGLGHAPVGMEKESTEILSAIKSLNDSGCVVVMASQCLYGRVNLTVYANLRRLAEAGAISGEDMTPETAFIKLAWLLGNYSAEEAKKLVGKNLRGEISECSRDLF